MKAVVLKEAGGIENLHITDVPKPLLQNNEVLIQTKAISINPVDVKTRKGGTFYEKLANQPPVILGWDVSGIVINAGADVTRFKKGDEVFGMVNFPGSGKAYAEFVVAPEEHLAHKPKNSTHQQAAASCLAALTAWQVLTQQAKVQKGENVLIHAASGGVGHFAVQIAKYLGAKVYGTCSAANIDFIKDIGADVAIDYTKEKFEDEAQNIDVVLDAVGGDIGIRSLTCLNTSGRIVTILGGTAEALKKAAAEKNIAAWGYLVQSNGHDMQQIAELLENGHLKPYISHQFSLDKIAAAHQQIETGKTRGKVVVSLE